MSATSSSVKRAEAVPMDTEVTVVSTGPHADLLQPARDTLDDGEEAILATAFVDTRESSSWMRSALCRVHLSREVFRPPGRVPAASETRARLIPTYVLSASKDLREIPRRPVHSFSPHWRRNERVNRVSFPILLSPSSTISAASPMVGPGVARAGRLSGPCLFSDAGDGAAYFQVAVERAC